MMPIINYYAVIVCGIVAMILGFTWYGPLFGKKWMALMNLGTQTPEEMKKAQQAMMPLYAMTFVLSVFQAFVLAYYIAMIPSSMGIDHAIWIWAGFLIPTVFGATMWSGASQKVAWSRFGIQASYYLVLFIVFGLILGMWK